MSSVLPYPRLSLLHLPSVQLIRARFYEENVPFYHHQDRYFGPPTAWQILLRNRYAHRPQDTLWLHVTATTVRETTTMTQRERMRRRVRQAVWEELRERGYDAFGRREEGPLKGTLEILIHQFDCLNATFAELRTSAGTIVGEVKRLNARRSRREQQHRFEEAKGVRSSIDAQPTTRDPYLSNEEIEKRWKKIKYARQMQQDGDSSESD